MYQGQTLQERQPYQKRRDVFSYGQNTENPSATISKTRQHSSLAKGMANNLGMKIAPALEILETTCNHYSIICIGE